MSFNFSIPQNNLIQPTYSCEAVLNQTIQQATDTVNLCNIKVVIAFNVFLVLVIILWGYYAWREKKLKKTI